MNALVPPPLDGEVIAPGDMLGVLAFMHPLKADYRLVLVPVGASVAEIVAACERECGMHRLTEGARVTINGEVVPATLWSRLRPKAGVHVTVRAVPRGFVVPLIVSGLSSVFTLSPFVTGLLTAGLGLLANLLMSALFPPATTKADKQKTVYSIGAARNEVAKWEPIPSVLGEVRMAAKYAAAPYTSFDGDDQYLYMLLVWGFGPLDINEIKIGETPIDDFEDVEHETLYGYMDGSKPDHEKQAIYTREVVQEELSIVVEPEDGYVSRTGAEDAIRIEADIVFPQGIYELKGGEYDDQFVKFIIEYRLYGSGASWSNLTTQEMRGDSTDPIRRTYGKKVAVGQYEVRVRNLSNSKFTPPTGVYRLSAQVYFAAANMVAGAQMNLGIYKNGAPYAFYLGRVQSVAAQSISLTCIAAASGSDYFEVYGRSDGTGDKTVLASAQSSFFELEPL